MVYVKYGELAMLQSDMFMDIPFFIRPLPHKDGWNSFLLHSLWKIVQSVGFEINFWSRSPIGQPFFSI